MKSRLAILLIACAVISMGSAARGCSAPKDRAEAKLETANNAVAGDKTQAAEFSLSAEDPDGFDLPEREEIRQKRKLTPGTEVLVGYGGSDFGNPIDNTQVFVIGIDGRVKVETSDTDAVEVLIVRSALKREDLERQKVQIDPKRNVENMFIVVPGGPDREPDTFHEIRQRVSLRLPRKVGLEIRRIGGDVTVGEVSGLFKIGGVTGNVRVARVAGTAVVGNVDGAGFITGHVDMTFAPLNKSAINLAGVNGDVNLRFEGEVNADLTAWNNVGAIKPDFPNVEIRESEPVRGGLKARIGHGGSLIEVHNVKGNVTLSKAANGDASALKVTAK